MGKDVFGHERYACLEVGCECTSYISEIDAMTDEERAMNVVHHPRNHPGYTTCVCGHSVMKHTTDPERGKEAQDTLQELSELLAEVHALEVCPRVGRRGPLGAPPGPPAPGWALRRACVRSRGWRFRL